MNGIPGLSLAWRKQHVHPSGETKSEAMFYRRFFDPFEVPTMNHYVHVFGVSNGRRLDSIYMDHDGAAADQFKWDLRCNERHGDLFERANQGE